MTAQDISTADRSKPTEPPTRPAAARSGLSQRASSVASTFRRAAVPVALASGTAALVEWSAMVLSGLLAAAVWRGPTSLADPAVLLPVLLVPLAAVVSIHTAGGYSVDRLRRHADRIGHLLGTFAAVFIIAGAAAVIAEWAPDGPRSWYLAWFAASAAALFTASFLTAIVVLRLTRAGRLQRRAVIVGGGPAAESLITALEKTGGNELRILGIFDDRADERSPESQQGYPKLGTIPELVEFARIAAVDLLIVSIPMSAETRLLQLLKQLWVLPVDIRLSAHANKLRFRPRSYSYVGRVPFLDLFDKPIAGWDSLVKRAFDLVFASLAVIAFSPVMLAVAIAIRLDSKGPVLFRQKRYGFNNEVIEVFKFRSMYHDMADPRAQKVVTKDDPRVTRVGRFIRRTSLDELPQFFNVLRGELSIVGPRPHAVNAHTSQRLWEEVVDGYFARHKVKPGVTGWAQINGWRGEVDTPDKIQGRVEHDLHYIENWSIFFDLYIMILTPLRILNQENAY